MFISKLIHTVETYDPYGLHRLNGVKVVYVFFVLAVFNMFFYLPHPYFYFFYLPITAMAAEVMMERIEDKYLGFVYTIVGTCAMVILFNMLRPYPLFFPVAIFAATVFLYFLALRHISMMLPLVPIILSLAAYSLLYPTLSLNFKMVMGNVLTTLFAMFIILSALLLFPLSYYYRLWLRAFSLACQEMLDDFLLMLNGEVVHASLLQANTKHMVGFSNMLPRKLPIYTILKINLLMHQLRSHIDVIDSSFMAMPEEELALLIQNLRLLIIAIEKEAYCDLLFTDNSNFTKLVHSWNYLCQRQ
ncbi:MAG: hypothetical protein K0U37_04960 [Gammaproteobacteria bacterium]|nr:hypothetical protein [Gammaproteobacteria bacterium]